MAAVKGFRIHNRKPSLVRNAAPERTPKLMYRLVSDAVLRLRTSTNPALRNIGHKSQVSRLYVASSITARDVSACLQLVWPESEESEAVEVVRQMESYGLVRRDGRESWKVVAEREKPVPAPVLTPTKWYSKPVRESFGVKVKPGVCPSCGEHVAYKNRHGRKNSAHTGEDCLLRKLRQVHNM